MAQTSKTSNIISAIVVIVGAIIFGIIWAGRSSMMGTAYKSSVNETVNYSGTATEADARALSEALITEEFFNGTNMLDVLLNKSEKGVVLSFVTNHQGHTSPAMIDGFKVLADRVAYSIGGLPLTLRLLDGKLNTKHEFTLKLEDAVWGLPIEINPGEWVHIFPPLTADDGRKLGQALVKSNFFTGSGAKNVFYRKTDQGVTISLVTTEEGYTSQAFEDEFRVVADQIAETVGGKPFTIRLIDDQLVEKKVLKIE